MRVARLVVFYVSLLLLTTSFLFSEVVLARTFWLTPATRKPFVVNKGEYVTIGMANKGYDCESRLYPHNPFHKTKTGPTLTIGRGAVSPTRFLWYITTNQVGSTGLRGERYWLSWALATSRDYDFLTRNFTVIDPVLYKDYVVLERSKAKPHRAFIGPDYTSWVDDFSLVYPAGKNVRIYVPHYHHPLGYWAVDFQETSESIRNSIPNFTLNSTNPSVSPLTMDYFDLTFPDIGSYTIVLKIALYYGTDFEATNLDKPARIQNNLVVTCDYMNYPDGEGDAVIS